MRCIGKGAAAGKQFCAVMYLPPPSTKFDNIGKSLLNTITEVAEKSMVNAANESKENGNSNIAVSLDGSWQKRGHKSLNGVVTAISMDTGKVIDVHCMSRYCQVCTVQRSDKEKNHAATCIKNYEGTSGGMWGDHLTIQPHHACLYILFFI